MRCSISDLRDYNVVRHFGKEVNSFKVKKIRLKRFDGCRSYLRAQAFICCEFDMT